MDHYITRVVRWMWRNKLTTTIGTSLVLAWLVPNLLRQICGSIIDVILGAIASLLSILIGELARNSSTLGNLITIGICVWAIGYMLGFFRKKRKRK